MIRYLRLFFNLCKNTEIPKALITMATLIRSKQISDTLNESVQTDIIVMDFSKAFDKVDHKKLLLKLHRFGINNDVITWIGSFLSNRTQRVVLEGEESDTYL